MLKTFPKGGIHPPENKFSSKEQINDLPLPEQVFIPVAQHIGAPSKILVKKGDQVKTGQVIAESAGFVSANIHSSVSGTVQKVDAIVDNSGYRKPVITIKVEGDEWEESIDTSKDLKKEVNASSAEILEKINKAGIVGLGGATFPSHVKLSIPPGKKAGYLLINGVECEPYLTADHRLMLERGEEVMVGVSLLMKALIVEKAVIGIENNKTDAIRYLSEIASGYPGITVQPLKVKYPQGGEKQLIKAILGREVPPGGLPIDVGVVVFNVGSSFAVYEAVQKNKPLFERVVTVTGKSLEKPSNFKVRIGTPVSRLIDEVGGLPDDTGKVVMGGPMMGKALPNIEIPVVKGTSGILAIPDTESKRKEVEPCIRCGKCVQVCPMSLEPYLLQVLGEKEMFERAEKERITDCIECGSCSFTCPASRPLLDYIRYAKTNVIKIIRSRKQ